MYPIMKWPIVVKSHASSLYGNPARDRFIVKSSGDYNDLVVDRNKIILESFRDYEDA